MNENEVIDHFDKMYDDMCEHLTPSSSREEYLDLMLMLDCGMRQGYSDKEIVLIAVPEKHKLVNHVYCKLRSLLDETEEEYEIEIKKYATLSKNLFINVFLESVDITKSNIAIFSDIIKLVDEISLHVCTNNKIQLSFCISNVFTEIREDE